MGRVGRRVAQLLLDLKQPLVGIHATDLEPGVLPLNKQTILVTEYQIEANDTLNGRLLTDIAYGYGLVPILHAKADHQGAKFMPSDDIRLGVGDRLVVLGTIEGLQRVERGSIPVGQWLVRVEQAVSAQAAFEGASVISRVCGCDMQLARTLMKQLAETLQYPLYKQ
ncbi:MAG: TrkA C-terminal domain-containing protein, partial [Nostoc sp.]